MKVFAIRIYADCFFLPEEDLQKFEIAMEKEAIYKTKNLYTRQNNVGFLKDGTKVNMVNNEGETWINTRHVSIVSRQIFEFVEN